MPALKVLFIDIAVCYQLRYTGEGQVLLELIFVRGGRTGRPGVEAHGVSRACLPASEAQLVEGKQ